MKVFPRLFDDAGRRFISATEAVLRRIWTCPIVSATFARASGACSRVPLLQVPVESDDPPACGRAFGVDFRGPEAFRTTPSR